MGLGKLGLWRETMSLPIHQLGWMAGVLDLKGMIIRKKNRSRATPQIVLAVESKHMTIIRELSRMTGTAPELQPAKAGEPWMRRGCVEHCPEQHVHAHKDPTMPAMGRWTVTGAAMVTVLYNVLPYLRNDTRGFAEAMTESSGDVVKSGAGRAAVDRALQRLSELDWDIPESVLPAWEEGEK